ncbi:dienelactone hydrolase family protein [Rufibacter glacialis]|uniref:Dienelactone hydrolase family protein n=1 Tax=Rufibacter glacialis TaxID=1259555 RepID=A0A5M8Q802_9BACT|nr:dienelactone hydrolase family protein [Rufibacter glacialis]KAA6430752.1 dienelactone hydrolase family protein [Rufibacter glacialis]GGK86462.1 carboxymethylenebutenolidase [Rufibacter glacialis]
MDQRIINLFDEYTHAPLSRKEFITRLAKLTGSLTLALSLLPLLENNYAHAATVEDPSIQSGDVTFPGADGVTMKGFQAQPKGKKKLGTVLVIHENRGLNPHIKDVALRVAQAGYIALAPDALSPLGGTPANEDEARSMFAKLNAKQNLGNFLKGLEYLQKHQNGNGKTGAVGFCWGGALVGQLAIHSPDLDAAVAYYGRQPEAADVSKIKAELLLHYGGLDERVNAGILAFEQALKEAGTKFQLYVYAGANHAFNNNTSPTRYHPEAAALAWQRTLDLFGRKLK